MRNMFGLKDGIVGAISIVSKDSDLISTDQGHSFLVLSNYVDNTIYIGELI